MILKAYQIFSSPLPQLHVMMLRLHFNVVPHCDMVLLCHSARHILLSTQMRAIALLTRCAYYDQRETIDGSYLESSKITLINPLNV